MHQKLLNLRHIVAYILGGAIALLLARILLKLFAARPENPVIEALFALTAPPPALVILDAGQPRFGAVLEFSTLALVVLLLGAGLLLRVWQRHRRN
jgi:hypothetical protein